MGLIYEKLIRPVLFTQEPEAAHEMVTTLLRWFSNAPLFCPLMARYNQFSSYKNVELFGLKFPNVVGLAAGMDKNAQFWRAMGALGFGFVEIGTITYQRQEGNPRPRIFRFPEQEALINRLGFNNDGAEIIAKRLEATSHYKRLVPLGINIGKSKLTSLENAADDYLSSFHLLADFADYFTINISSPNTPDIRKLQESELLSTLLSPLREANLNRAKIRDLRPIPMLVKIAPDLSFPQIDSVLQIISEFEINGIIATNTTIERAGPLNRIKEEGGLSGTPIHKRSLEVIRYISRATNGKLPIVGVGGINDIRTAEETLTAGASLIQIYTGMIYKGPFLAKNIARSLSLAHSH